MPSETAEEGSADTTEQAPAEPTPQPEPPEWLIQARATADPKEMIGLLAKNMDREALMADPVLSAILGNMSDRRARDLLRQADQQKIDHDRQAAYDRGDLYTLGQMSAVDLQAQRQQAEQQAQAALNPYMLGITRWQSSLPEVVQRDVQGKTFAPGGTPEEGFAAYLQAVHESALRHGLEDEVRKREPALRKAELNATVGTEMNPELDGGPAQQYREITDAQVASMTLEEYDRYFDEKGRPRPGVRVNLTRGIDVRREQRR